MLRRECVSYYWSPVILGMYAKAANLVVSFNELRVTTTLSFQLHIFPLVIFKGRWKMGKMDLLQLGSYEKQ